MELEDLKEAVDQLRKDGESEEDVLKVLYLMYTKDEFGIDMLRDSHKRQKTRYNQTLSKIDVFRFSVLLNLNKTEIIQFMSYCGYGFNPTSRLDMFFMDYIKGKYGIFGKQRKLYEMDLLFMPTAKDGVQFTV